jgi:hypothetical protein
MRVLKFVGNSRTTALHAWLMPGFRKWITTSTPSIPVFKTAFDKPYAPRLDDSALDEVSDPSAH